MPEYTKDDFIQDSHKHIARVQQLLSVLTKACDDRGKKHDKSKLSDPEASEFAKVLPELRNTQYGSPAYQDCLARMKPVLEHHYQANRHHPEHHKNGYKDMDLVDVMEMFADWMAASERNEADSAMKSIDTNKKRFQLSDDFVSIFKNTIKNYF